MADCGLGRIEALTGLGRMADRSWLLGDFAPSDPLMPRFRRQIRDLHENMRSTHPSRASGADFE
eukprot:12889121-Alexandrium_andersonii.AAC.1